MTFSVAQAVGLAFQHHQAGRLAEAEIIYLKILEQEPSNANVLHLLGLIRYASGKFDEAIGFITQAITVAPNIPEFYNNLGEALRAAGRPEEAITNYEQALALRSSYAEARNNLGNAWLQLGKLELAEASYRKAISDQPNYAEAHYNLGYALSAQKKFQEALTCLTEAIRLRPNFAAAYYHLGNALRELARPQEAIDRFRDAIKLDPNFADAYNNLANLLLAPEQGAERLACYKKAIALQPRHPQANTTLGILLQQSGQFSAAAQCFEVVLQVQPENEAVRHLLNAVQQKNAARAPLSYVREVYDGYADEFDTHLSAGLAYRIPQELSQLLRKNIAIPETGWDIVDLGCGTGLNGLALKDIARSLVGVDASPKMLEKAKERGIYQTLFCEDMVEFLRNDKPASRDLIVATDVFIYTGDLSEIFNQSSHVLRNEGVLAFSIESTEQHESDFELQLSGRYSHHPKYIQRLAREQGFTLLTSVPTTIRTEREIPVPGYIVILVKATEQC